MPFPRYDNPEFWPLPHSCLWLCHSFQHHCFAFAGIPWDHANTPRWQTQSPRDHMCVPQRCHRVCSFMLFTSLKRVSCRLHWKWLGYRSGQGPLWHPNHQGPLRKVTVGHLNVVSSPKRLEKFWVEEWPQCRPSPAHQPFLTHNQGISFYFTAVHPSWDEHSWWPRDACHHKVTVQLDRRHTFHLFVP